MPTDLYGGNVVKPFLGRVVLKKLAGAGPISVGTQVVIPLASAMPRNPLNFTYLTGVNALGYESGDVQGKRSPSVTLTTVVKTSSFFTAAFLNSLIFTTDGTYADTDTWAILLDDIYEQDIYDGAKCAGLHLRQFSKGGPVAFTMAFVSMYGDNENPGTIFTPTTFSATSADPGPVTDVTKIAYGSGPSANLVEGFALDVIRPQNHVFYDDGTVFPAGVTSGILTGRGLLTQSVKYTESWGSTGQIYIGQTSAGVEFSLLTNLDQDVKDMTKRNRMKVRHYRLYDITNGGAPVTATAM